MKYATALMLVCSFATLSEASCLTQWSQLIESVHNKSVFNKNSHEQQLVRPDQCNYKSSGSTQMHTENLKKNHPGSSIDCSTGSGVLAFQNTRITFDNWKEVSIQEISGSNITTIDWINSTISGVSYSDTTHLGSWSISLPDNKIVSFMESDSAKDLGHEMNTYYNTVCPNTSPDQFLFKLLNDKQMQGMVSTSVEDVNHVVEAADHKETNLKERKPSATDNSYTFASVDRSGTESYDWR